MKKSFFAIASVVLCVVMFTSCNNKNEVNGENVDNERGELVTKKILYDVPIVNLRLQDRSVNDPNWFWENLPFPDGDKFVDKLFADARDCKMPIYEYDPEGDYEHLKRIPDNDVKKLFEKDMVVSIPVPDVLDEATGNFVSSPDLEFQLDQTKILKLRFLEEWRFVDGMIVKKVLAVAPVFTINITGFDDEDGLEYNTVKFWVMADEKLLK